jgi:hypothetical protein
MRAPKPSRRAGAACTTLHQPGRRQNARQISQPQGGEGGYFFDRLILGMNPILNMVVNV